MNAKLVVALILTLQVSLSLCDIPTPSPGLLEKYDEVRAAFLQWAADRSKAVVDIVGQIHESRDQLQENLMVQDLVNVATELNQDWTEVLRKTRLALLALYERHLHPSISPKLHEFFTDIKPILDKYVPGGN